jgi:hypothetical protein
MFDDFEKVQIVSGGKRYNVSSTTIEHVIESGDDQTRDWVEAHMSGGGGNWFTNMNGFFGKKKFVSNFMNPKSTTTSPVRNNKAVLDAIPSDAIPSEVDETITWDGTSFKLGKLDYTGKKEEIVTITIADDVKEIPPKLFEDCQKLTTVKFGKGSKLSNIGECAFKGCTELCNITLPNTVVTIGKLAFSNCKMPDVFTLPDLVNEIEEGTFMLTKITTFKFGDKSQLKTIQGRAFGGCVKLLTIKLPNTVTDIGNDAFLNCRELTEFTVPDSIINIGEYSFFNCITLSKISLPAIANTTMLNISDTAFRQCPKLSSIELSTQSTESLTDIGRENKTKIENSVKHSTNA